MATHSFAEQTNEQAEPKIAHPDQVPARMQDVSSDVIGEITSEHKKLPRLNLSQKSGTLVDDVGGAGKLVLNKEIVLLDKLSDTIEGLTVAKIKLVYQEDLPYDPQSVVMPRVAATAEEVLSMGGSTKWGDDNYFKPIAHMLVLFPAPEGISDEVIESQFPHEFEDKWYAAAVYTAAGSSFTEGAKNVFTALDNPKVRQYGIRYVQWRVQVVKKSNPRNSWFAVSMKRCGTNSQQFIDWSKEVLP